MFSVSNRFGLQRHQYCLAGSGSNLGFALLFAAARESACDIVFFGAGAYRKASDEYLGAGWPVTRVRISSARTERTLGGFPRPRRSGVWIAERPTRQATVTIANALAYRGGRLPSTPAFATSSGEGVSPAATAAANGSPPGSAPNTA